MNKQEMIHLLIEKYDAFERYIETLSTHEYLYRYESKWSAGQQLEHIVICVKPLVQVFSMDKEMIEQRFGRSYTAVSRGYEALLSEYLEKLHAGGSAPSRFVPETNLSEQRPMLIQTLKDLIQVLAARIETFTDEELDSLLIPHPLLGNLTLREMLYNAIYHVEHHQEMAKANLKHMATM